MLLLLSACGSSPETEQEDSLYLFKPGKNYPYLLTAKDSSGTIFSTDTVTLFVKDSSATDYEEEQEHTYYSLSLAGHWSTDSIPEQIPAQLTADEHAYTLAFPSIYQHDFTSYTLPLEVDWMMEEGKEKNQLVKGLTAGTLHPGPSYSIRRVLTYVGAEDLKIGKSKYSKCRKMIALDESPIGKVKVTYWVHPESGFVQALYQHVSGEREFVLQQKT